MLVIGSIPTAPEAWFTGRVPPARRLSDLRYRTVVLHRWVYVVFVIFWLLMVVLGLVLVVHRIRNHVPFDFNFGAGWIALLALALILVRARRVRKNAAARTQSRY